MAKIKFSKMHGGGNDFVVIDAVRQKISSSRLLNAAQHISDRRLGVGCDQILILRSSKNRHADFQYQIINADGGEVGQCGNGARCAHAFLRQEKITNKHKLTLHTLSTTIITENVRGDIVRAHLAVPQFTPAVLPMSAISTKSVKIKDKNHYQPQWYNTRQIKEVQKQLLQHLPQHFCALSLGNPHAVFVWDGEDSLESGFTTSVLHRLGLCLNQSKFFPQGVNVGFYCQRGSKIVVRVYERGVGETPSCGSGAAAATVVHQYFNNIKKPVQVEMKGGNLTCHWLQEKSLPVNDSPVWLQGKINFAFNGEVEI